MGKPTGFLDYSRRENPILPPAVRLESYNEFHTYNDPVERKCQAGRCMDCGVPFCQAAVVAPAPAIGCPLGNLIPEWNDLLYRGSLPLALDRLLLTINFPEFTGRVCPALCEGSCTCGHTTGESVTVRDNELYIIESAFAQGLMQPRPPKTRTGKRVAVVGSGPSGLAVADQLNRRGHWVTVFEKSDRPGGLLQYGIPNMKLDKRAVSRRISLMEAEGVTFRVKTDATADGMAQRLLEDFDAVAICCGAGLPRSLGLPSQDETAGIHFAVDYLTAATKGFLSGRESEISAKGKQVVVVGGGDTGNDCVGTALRQGCAGLVELEMMPPAPETRAPGNPWPQWPRVKKTDYGQEEAIYRFGADPRLYQTTVKALIADENHRLTAIRVVRLRFDIDAATGRSVMTEVPNSEQEIPCDLLLIAAGFLGCQPEVAGAFGLTLTPRGTLPVGKGHATPIPGLFAAGDCKRGQSLVVTAISEGRACAREIDEVLMGYSNL